ncbi:MAG: response regulator [Myxococcota bacterium]
METVRLTESLSIDPENSDVRAALADHLERLRDAAADGGFANLEAAVAAALRTLLDQDFDPESVRAVRVLAWRYDELAAMPGRSGTHPVVTEATPRGDTVRSLVDEVTGEIRKGLLEAARNGGRDAPLREGNRNEILTPVWKAISELRALIEERSEGEVRFGEDSAIPLLTLSGVEGPEEPVDVNLSGRRILVADDDAEVRWFYVGVLREAGARVVEASDGLRALELIREDPPDLILADILMPRLDGLGLCAAVRREPGLDGVPVVLLSWRDDFLHRMRELRAEARDYLRKELPARQLLARVAGVLEPLIRLEASLRADGEARGDLEDLGVAALLRAVARCRPNAALALQDPWSLFEVELADGAIVSVSCTTIDGRVAAGEPVLLPLAGMNTGRYVITGTERAGQPRASLDGAFLAATARLSALIDALTDHPEAPVELDPKMLHTTMRHSPQGIQSIVRRLADGESPREITDSLGGSRAVVDALLITLARHGAVLGVDTPAPDPVSPAWEDERMSPSDTVATTGALQESSPSAVRENVRAQSAVSMHRQPANRVSRPSEAIWRSRTLDDAGAEDSSSFRLETSTTPRLLALGLLGALLSTLVFLLSRGSGLEAPPGVEPASEDARAVASEAEPMNPFPTDLRWLADYAGSLRYQVDDQLRATPSQGALELIGPEEVRVRVDGIDRGNLPVTVVLGEGRHMVRYGVQGAWTYRLYYVKRGATRTMVVRWERGGLVDAR